MQQIQQTATMEDREAIDGMIELENALEPPQQEEAEEKSEEIRDTRIESTESRIELRQDCDMLKRMLKSVVALTDKDNSEAVLRISKDGIAILKHDGSEISLMKVFIPNRQFIRYEVKETVNLNVDIRSLDKLLSQLFKSAKKSKGATDLIIKEYNTKMSFELIQSDSRRSLRIPTIDFDMGKLDKEPICNYNATFQINGDTFRKALNDASLISAYIGIVCNGDSTITLLAKGDAGEHEESYEITDKLSLNGEQKAVYNVEFLLKALKTIDKKTKIEVQFSTNEVMKIRYVMGDMPMEFWLAPYVE